MFLLLRLMKADGCQFFIKCGTAEQNLKLWGEKIGGRYNNFSHKKQTIATRLVVVAYVWTYTDCCQVIVDVKGVRKTKETTRIAQQKHS